MTPSAIFTVLLLSILQSCVTYATVTSNWTNPNARLPSFSSTYLVGERIWLSWLALNTSRDDLWLTRYDETVDNYSLRITSDLDLSVDGSFAWTVAVADQVVLADTRFVFVFTQTGSTFGSDVQAQMQLQSPAFNIMLVNQATAPNGTVGASSIMPSATATSTSSMASQTATDASAATPSHRPKDSGTMTARTVGIAVAVLIAVAIAGFLVGYVFFRRRQSRHNHKVNLGDSKSDITLSGPYEVLADTKAPVEANGKETQLHEMNSKEAVGHEMEAAIVHEAATIVKRPGLHEMAG